MLCISFLILCNFCSGEIMSFIKEITYSREGKIYPSHSHVGIHQMVYIRNGDVVFRSGEKSYHITEPSVVFIGSDDPHSFISNNYKYERYCVSMFPEDAPNITKSDRLISIFVNRPPEFSHVLSVEKIKDRLDILFEMLYNEFMRGERDLPDSDMVIFRSILVLLYRFSPDAFPYEDESVRFTVHKIKERLAADLTERITLRSLSDEFHLSECYISRVFSKHVGMSLKAYRQKCKLSSACELLASTNFNITEICNLTGFTDMSNFSRYFKKEFGITPTEYRNRNKSNII